MKCPYCKADNDRVLDTRQIDDGFAIRRRRECLSCKRRYTTYERLEEIAVKVVKKDGVRESFSREKILNGLARACWKRPVSDEAIHAIVAAVESQVYAANEPEIDTTDLGMLVMDHLRDVDQVAYVRFASVYREFEDARDFVHELQPMLDKHPRPPNGVGS